MNFFIENQMFFFKLLFFLLFAILVIIWFVHLPKWKQAEVVREWLLLACIAAEEEFGGGTGAKKLEHVHREFGKQFPKTAKIVPFKIFCKWINMMLIEMEKVLSEQEKQKEKVKEEQKEEPQKALDI